MKQMIPIATSLLLLGACATKTKLTSVYPVSPQIEEQAQHTLEATRADLKKQQAIAADIERQFNLAPVQVKLMITPQGLDEAKPILLVSDVVPLKADAASDLMPYALNAENFYNPVHALPTGQRLQLSASENQLLTQVLHYIHAAITTQPLPEASFKALTLVLEAKDADSKGNYKAIEIEFDAYGLAYHFRNQAVPEFNQQYFLAYSPNPVQSLIATENKQALMGDDPQVETKPSQPEPEASN